MSQPINYPSRADKRRLLTFVGAALLINGLSSCAGVQLDRHTDDFTLTHFEKMLSTLAEGWNTNDAALAASVFADDAVYSEPPDKQLYRGRQSIYDFFGGDAGRLSWMKMDWHNISFNQQRKVGAAEFTFSWDGGQVHGMVSIKIEHGLISKWREYFYESELDWDEFQKHTQF